MFAQLIIFPTGLSSFFILKESLKGKVCAGQIVFSSISDNILQLEIFWFLVKKIGFQ